jgi:DNA-directed RNA polymerase beta subunit
MDFKFDAFEAGDNFGGGEDALDVLENIAISDENMTCTDEDDNGQGSDSINGEGTEDEEEDNDAEDGGHDGSDAEQDGRLRVPRRKRPARAEGAEDDGDDGDDKDEAEMIERRELARQEAQRMERKLQRRLMRRGVAVARPTARARRAVTAAAARRPRALLRSKGMGNSRVPHATLAALADTLGTVSEHAHVTTADRACGHSFGEQTSTRRKHIGMGEEVDDVDADEDAEDALLVGEDAAVSVVQASTVREVLEVMREMEQMDGDGIEGEDGSIVHQNVAAPAGARRGRCAVFKARAATDAAAEEEAGDSDAEALDGDPDRVWMCSLQMDDEDDDEGGCPVQGSAHARLDASHLPLPMGLPADLAAEIDPESVQNFLSEFGHQKDFFNAQTRVMTAFMKLNPPERRVFDAFEHFRTHSVRAALENRCVKLSSTAAGEVYQLYIRNPQVALAENMTGSDCTIQYVQAAHSQPYGAAITATIEHVSVTVPPEIQERLVGSADANALAMELFGRVENGDRPNLSGLVKRHVVLDELVACLPQPVGIVPPPLGGRPLDPCVKGTLCMGGSNLQYKTLRFYQMQAENTQFTLTSRKGVVTTTNRSHHERDCRSASTFRLTTSLESADVRAFLQWPKDATAPIAFVFFILQVRTVDSMITYTWPNGVPPAERHIEMTARVALQAQLRGLAELSPTFTEGDPPKLWYMMAMFTEVQDRLKRTADSTALAPEASRAAISKTARHNTYVQCVRALVAEILPHQGNKQNTLESSARRALGVGSMLRATLLRAFRLRGDDNRDAAHMQVHIDPFNFLTRKLASGMKSVTRMLRHSMKRTRQLARVDTRIISSELTSILFGAVRTGNLGETSSSKYLTSLIEAFHDPPLPSESGAAFKKCTGNTPASRKTDEGFLGVVDVLGTTDGKECGKTGRFTACRYSTGRPGRRLEAAVLALLPREVVAPLSISTDPSNRYAPHDVDHVGALRLQLNGRFVCRLLHVGAEEVVSMLRTARRRGFLPWDVSVSYSPDPYDNTVCIWCTHGLSFFPAIILSAAHRFLSVATSARCATSSELLQELERVGAVEYLCPIEATCGRVAVATDIFHLLSARRCQRRFTHMFLHPCQPVCSDPLGVHIPMHGTNEAARMLFARQQLNHCTGDPFHGKKCGLAYTQRPLVYSALGDAIAEEQHLHHVQTAVVAVAQHPLNIEDSVVVNRASAERGLFATVHTVKYHIMGNFSPKLIVLNPLLQGEDLCWKAVSGHLYGADYSQLDERGIIRKGAIVRKGFNRAHGMTTHTVLVCRVRLENGEYREDSVTFKSSPHFAYRVQDVKVNDRARIKKIVVTLSRMAFLMDGDKLSTRQGQKTTVRLVEDADMPWIARGPMAGVRVDMVYNPIMFKRGTGGFPLEMLASKAAALTGVRFDGTPFRPMGPLLQDPLATNGPVTSEWYSEVLKPLSDAGVLRESLRDGVTGCLMAADAVGIMSLLTMAVHTPAGKLDARPILGGTVRGNRQPRQGGEDGSKRMGQMEVHALISSGIADVSRDLGARCDATMVPVCESCGLLGENKPFGLMTTRLGHDPSAAELRVPLDKCMDTNRCQVCGGNMGTISMRYISVLLDHKLRNANMALKFYTRPMQLDPVSAVTRELAEQHLADISAATSSSVDQCLLAAHTL